MTDKPDLETVVDRLLQEVRVKNTQLEEIRREINRSNRDYEKLTIVGAIKNLRTTLTAVEKENRKMDKELKRLITRK